MLNVMDMNVFYFEILSKFDFNMATTNTAVTKAKQSNKRLLINGPPPKPLIFYKFHIFFFMKMQNIYCFIQKNGIVKKFPLKTR